MGTVHQYPKEKVTLYLSMAPIHMLKLRCLLPHVQTPRIYGSFVRVEKRPGYEGGLEDMEVTYLAAASTTEVRRHVWR